MTIVNESELVDSDYASTFFFLRISVVENSLEPKDDHLYTKLL